MTPDEAAVEIAIRESPALWLTTCGAIEEKRKQIARGADIKLNVFQQRMSQAYEWQRAQGLPPRMICLKPRRVGGTTMGAAISYHHMRNFPCNGVMIADTHGKSQKLLGMYERFALYDRFNWHSSGDKRSNQILQLGHSVVERHSAEAPRGTRGDTLQCLHGSEVAFWPSTPGKSAEETSAALRSALADHEDTLDVEESTPKGAAGLFYTMWNDARWPEYDNYWSKWGAGTQESGPGNGYIRVFAAWYEFADYQHAIDSEQERLDIIRKMQPRDRKGQKLYGWTYEQIKWRTWAIKNKTLNNEKRFDEEYAEDPTSCFLSSGSPRFDSEGLTALRTRCRSVAVEHGTLTENGGRVLFLPGDEGSSVATRWEQPRVGCRYLISVDPLTGKEVDGSHDTDRCSVLVWRAGYLGSDGKLWPPRLVARLRPPWRAENTPTARHIWYLHRLYGGCIVVVESNVGVGLIDKLKDLQVDLYHREKFDLITSKHTRYVGWETTEQTRDLSIDALGDACREQTVDIGCPHLVSEMETFVRNAKGKYEAASGKHDDDCFVAGTRVLTPLGEVPIESLKVGDWVVTRDGAHRIIHTFARVKPVISRLGLVGTSTHPIITPAGEKDLASLSDIDTLYMWKPSQQSVEKRSFTTARNTTDTLCRSGDNCAYIFGDMISGSSRPLRSIANFGSTIMDRFQRSMLSITKTITRSITRLETWNSSWTVSTPSTMPETQKSSGSTVRMVCAKHHGSRQLWLTGRKPQRPVPSIQQMPRLFWQSLSANWRARAAALCSSPLFATLGIALRVVTCGSRIVSLAQRRKVYNLHVEGSHEYFANGILVHNCMSSGIGLRTIESATLFVEQVRQLQLPTDYQMTER